MAGEGGEGECCLTTLLLFVTVQRDLLCCKGEGEVIQRKRGIFKVPQLPMYSSVDLFRLFEVIADSAWLMLQCC